MKTRNYLPLIGLGVLMVALHLLTVWTGTQYYLTQLTMSAYYGLVIIGLGVLMGYAGQISIGHAGFFAIGGYLAAALTTRNLEPFAQNWWVQLLDKAGVIVHGQDIYGLSQMTFTPWLACIVAVTTAGLVALVIGIPVLKLKGHYLAMATLGFGTIVYRIFLAMPYFGESDGITEVPGFDMLPFLTISGDMSHRVLNFYASWTLLIVGMLFLINLIGSRVGRALRSLHSSEEAAEASGINAGRFKLKVFVLSAIYAAVAGVLLTHYNGGIGPSEASMAKSVRYVALVAVGGMLNLWGTLIMGVGLTFLSLRGVFGSFDDAVFGTILILVMLFSPEGILGLKLRPLLRQLIIGGRA